MNVKELIEKLKKVDGKKTVFIMADHDANFFYELCEIEIFDGGEDGKETINDYDEGKKGDVILSCW